MSSLIENVWIVADRSSHDLGRVWPRRPLALLPIAGRPLLAYVMDELFEAKIPKATISLSGEVDTSRRLLADGARWGVELREALTRGQTPKRRIVAESEAAGPILVIHADRFRTPAVATFLRAASRLGPRQCLNEPTLPEGSIIAEGEDGRPLGIELVNGINGPQRTLVLPTTCSFDVATPEGIQAANLAAVSGLIDVALHAREVQEGVWVGRQAQVGRRVTLTAPAFIGAGCEVGDGAVVGPNAFLGPNCFLEPGARVQNAVLLEQTFVSPRSDLENAVANGKEWLPLKTSPLKPKGESGLSRLDASVAMRWLSSRVLRYSVAAFILVILPLLLVWYCLAAAASPNAPLRHLRLRSNRPAKETFLAFEATSWPYIRRMPWLLAVVTGDLDLVGVRPSRPDRQTQDRPWREEILGSARAGLAGPALLLPDATPLARDLAEAAWLADRTWRSDLALLARVLLQTLDVRRWLSTSTPRIETAP